MGNEVTIGTMRIGQGNPLALMAGPCVIEGREECLDLALKLAELAQEENIPLVFKASYDKANRSSLDSYRGPGLEEGLEILSLVKERTGLPILTDVHGVEEVGPAAQVADVLQIPAMLARQTDLVVAAGESGCAVNVKKAQFMAPWDAVHVVRKIESTGNQNIMITERGACFGYNNLVADMRSLMVLGELGYPVVFDATHSVQRPGGGATSGGDGRWAPALARAAVATGCDAVFVEAHTSPRSALSDRDTVLSFSVLREMWTTLRAIDEIVG